MSAIKHGTYAGAIEHSTRGEERCGDCRRAAKEYMAVRRESEDVRNADRARDRARRRAMWRLVALHPADYALLFGDEKAKEPVLVERARKRERS
jgi:bacterioferritin-associated ferredoxin